MYAAIILYMRNLALLLPRETQSKPVLNWCGEDEDYGKDYEFQHGCKAEAIDDCWVWISKHFINAISKS